MPSEIFPKNNGFDTVLEFFILNLNLNFLHYNVNSNKILYYF